MNRVVLRVAAAFDFPLIFEQSFIDPHSSNSEVSIRGSLIYHQRQTFRNSHSAQHTSQIVTIPAEAEFEAYYEKLLDGNLSHAQRLDLFMKMCPKAEDEAAYVAWSSKKLLALRALLAKPSKPFDVGKFVEFLTKTNYNKHEDREKLCLAMCTRPQRFFPLGKTADGVSYRIRLGYGLLLTPTFRLDEPTMLPRYVLGVKGVLDVPNFTCVTLGDMEKSLESVDMWAYAGYGAVMRFDENGDHAGMYIVLNYSNTATFRARKGDRYIAVSGPEVMDLHDLYTYAKLKTSLFSLPMPSTSELTLEISEKTRHDVTVCRTKNGENDTVVHFDADDKKRENTAKVKDEKVDG